MDVPRALHVPTDDGFEATALTIGPWDPGLQHAGPPAALLAREVERRRDRGRPVGAAGLRHPRSGAGGPRARARLRRPARAPDRARGGRPHRGRRPAADAPDRLADARPDRRRRPAARRAAAPGACRTEESAEEVAAFIQDVAYHRALDWRFAGSFNSRTRDGLDELPLRAGRGRADDGAEHLLVMTDAAMRSRRRWTGRAQPSPTSISWCRCTAHPTGSGSAWTPRRCLATAAPPRRSPSSSTPTARSAGPPSRSSSNRADLPVWHPSAETGRGGRTTAHRHGRQVDMCDAMRNWSTGSPAAAWRSSSSCWARSRWHASAGLVGGRRPDRPAVDRRGRSGPLRGGQAPALPHPGADLGGDRAHLLDRGLCSTGSASR